MNSLRQFIAENRNRFRNEHNNVFAICFSKILRRNAFLEIILRRYERAAAVFIDNSKALQASMKEGGHDLSDAQMEMFNKSGQLTSEVHLEIESYYLFAKIILDDIARRQH